MNKLKRFFRAIAEMYIYVVGDECYLCHNAQRDAGNSGVRCPCCEGHK